MKKVVVIVLVLILAGCVNPRAVLVNDQGQEVICEAAGFGIISGTLANNRYQECVSEAQMRGFRFKEQKR